MIQGILYMCIVGVCWTSFGVIMGYAPKRKIHVGLLLFFSALTALTVSGVTALLTGLPQNVPFRPYLVTFLALFVCGALNYPELEFMSRSMQNGPNGIIWSLIQSSFVFPFLAGVLFLKAQCSAWNTLGILLLLLSLLLMGLSKSNKANGPWRLLAYMAFLITGVAQILSNLPSYSPAADSINSSWRTTYFALGLFCGSLVGILRDKEGHPLQLIKDNVTRPALWLFVFVLEGFEILASIFLLYPGMDLLEKAGVGAIAYPLLVAAGIIAFEAYSILCLKEKRSTIQILAILFMLLGIAGLCHKA